MGWIGTIIAKRREKIRARNEACDQLIAQIDIAIKEKNSLFLDELSFIEPGKEVEWNRRNFHVFEAAKAEHVRKLKKAEHFYILAKKQEELYNSANAFKQQIWNHNSRVAEARIQNAYALIGGVEGQRLDRQQMECIVKETRNHLVIAGAGTGKTTTIIGKIKFLLKSGKCSPDDILVLSFTNASAAEMCQRINRETGRDIEASTFHKLGLNIIKKVDGVVPKITQLNLYSFVNEQMQQNMQEKHYFNLLSTYLLYHRVVPKSEFEFQTQAEYEEYLRFNPPATIHNETVKSYGEMDIANFLAQNGIQYCYEQPYKIDTRTSEYGQYYPDFYLPEYDIYIEYFGVNRNGEVPAYFKGANGMTATQRYQASMKWKREMHRENNTVMVACYAYEKWEGTLLENLKRKLEAQSVTLTPKVTKELWEQISAGEDHILDGLVKLFETMICLMKSNRYTIDTVRQMNIQNGNVSDNHILLLLLEPIYNAYNAYLKEHNEIDFNDMINLATQYIEQKKFVNPYRYVIVDEYQDISKSRFRLLDSLRKSGDYELFCVGDDWQSIYRFAGSDIGFILNFERYWGPSEISKIETTYRFTQKLIEVSGTFIMQNPAQVKKSMRGKRDSSGFVLGEITGYTDLYAMEFAVKKLDNLPTDSSVFFIGRYSFDVKGLDSTGLVDCQYNSVSGRIEIRYEKRPDLKMCFLTAHKAKGLQADYVFIINNKKSRMGFPSKIQDASILSLLLESSDQYPYAEERRLFYVALTRAKKKVYLVTVKNQESEFAAELEKRYQNELKKERFSCPLCGGSLVKRTGPYGAFFACSNYKSSGCTYTMKIKPAQSLSKEKTQGNV